MLSSNNEKLFTVPDLATFFKVKPETVRHWIRKYKIPVVKIGKRIYVRPEAVDRFLDKRTIESIGDHPSTNPT